MVVKLICLIELIYFQRKSEFKNLCFALICADGVALRADGLSMFDQQNWVYYVWGAEIKFTSS